ncbi:TPA: DUF2163 domain-containing protein [Klebsiella aerogenes]|nr:DUF2163 domain-containing protein [Klebsiella pneumoniae]HDS2560956.1 DUF2163 domain-containing protein [Klebsiella aerogenes]HBW7417047.1 DUF2163 domain-containing protein [Klebsiella pneumoniae]HBW7526781.1 DUF2163 domain-containing protein [Klebsiella pneumoniae]HBW7761407.1 DUF2163 domain-containing protein [Klebsiella pneumoniae]
MDDFLTNPDIIAYYNERYGTDKTELSFPDLFGINVVVFCYDLFPDGMSGFHWTDSLIDLDVDGYRYTSFPFIIGDSLKSVTEEKGINNNQLSLKISNVNTSVRSLALSNAFRNAQFNIKLAIMNPQMATIIGTILIYSGYVDYFQSVTDPIQGKNELTVYLNSVYQKLDIQPSLIAANSAYQSYYPGDEFFSLLGQVNQNQIWKYK